MAASSSCSLPVGVGKMQQILKVENGEDDPFKCAVCKNYLSISPIVHNDILGSICGRDFCKKVAAAEGTNYRQSAYERLAKASEFPCMYEENGCKKVLPWNEIGEHEKICEFVKLCCPFSTDRYEDAGEICTWEGNTSEISVHMEEVHSTHRFENYVKISLDQDIKKNKLLFSKIQDSIVILLVVIGAESNTYRWKVSEIWKHLNYKIEVFSENQTLKVSKFQKAELLYPSFLRSKIDNSWFKINIDSIKNLFDSPCFLTTKFYVKGFLVGSPENLSCNDINSILPMPNITCGRCSEQAEIFIFVCKIHKVHKLCEMCGHNFNCSWCQQQNYGTNTHLCKTFIPKIWKALVYQSFEYCTLCEAKVQCLSSHLCNSHSESIFSLGECHNFSPKHYFFSFDDHIFLFSSEFNGTEGRKISVQCLGTQTVKYKYELKLMSTATLNSAITLTNFCYSELINDLQNIIDVNVNETSIPYHFYNSIFQGNNIEFKLDIFKI